MLPLPTETPVLHDIKIVRRRKKECARVVGVPPEEFGIGRNDRCIKDAGYCFHEVLRRESDLISDGYNAEQIKKLPSYTITQGTEETARDTVDESTAAEGDNGANTANRMIKVTEHYVRMDYEDNGKVCLYRVTTAGDQGEILTRDGKPEIIKEDCIPFAAMTPFIVTHRFFGKSVADFVMDIMRIKTALLRGALDNLYLHNNPRVEVAEQYASENTLDDLLVSRPGGIVRTKQPGGLQWQTVPDITTSIYPALQYFDATREWRTGVSRQGQGLDANALQNQSATAASQLFTAAQARIKLIARIFAETGIRDLFSLLHATIRKNGSVQQTVRLRNEWVTVDPREWKSRNDMTINVGLGTGGKEQQLAFLQLLIGAQEKALAAGMVSKGNLYNSAKELVKLIGRKDPESFFTAPQEEEAQQPIPMPEPPEIQKAKIDAELRQKETQGKAEIEKLQAQADIASQNNKTQAEIARDDRKFQQESVQAEREHQMRMAEMQLKLVSQLASAAAKPKPGPVVEGKEGEAVQTQTPGPDIDEILAKLAPLMAPPTQSGPRRRTITTPSGKTYTMDEG